MDAKDLEIQELEDMVDHLKERNRMLAGQIAHLQEEVERLTALLEASGEKSAPSAKRGGRPHAPGPKWESRYLQFKEALSLGKSKKEIMEEQGISKSAYYRMWSAYREETGL